MSVGVNNLTNQNILAYAANFNALYQSVQLVGSNQNEAGHWPLNLATSVMVGTKQVQVAGGWLHTEDLPEGAKKCRLIVPGWFVNTSTNLANGSNVARYYILLNGQNIARPAISVAVLTPRIPAGLTGNVQVYDEASVRGCLDDNGNTAIALWYKTSPVNTVVNADPIPDLDIVFYMF